jgi:hypothetical protein
MIFNRKKEKKDDKLKNPNITKAARSFGEKAANIIGDVVNDSIKNVGYAIYFFLKKRQEIQKSIKESTNTATDTIKKSATKFGDKIREMGVESLTEWVH